MNSLRLFISDMTWLICAWFGRLSAFIHPGSDPRSMRDWRLGLSFGFGILVFLVVLAGTLGALLYAWAIAP